MILDSGNSKTSKVFYFLFLLFLKSIRFFFSFVVDNAFLTICWICLRFLLCYFVFAHLKTS